MEAGPINNFLFVASDFAPLIRVGSLLLLADFVLSLVRLVCLPENDGGLRRVWPFTRVKTSPIIVLLLLLVVVVSLLMIYLLDHEGW